MSYYFRLWERKFIMNHEKNPPKYKINHILTGGIVILLIINSMVFVNKLMSLEKQVQHLSGIISGYQFSGDLSGMEARILEEMKKGESILTDATSLLTAKEDYFEVTLKVAPRKIGTEDKVFILLDNQKIQARSINGVTYEAVVPVTSLKPIKPYVVIESGDDHLQEVLPEINFDEYTYVELSSIGFSEEDKNLTLELTAFSEKTLSLMENIHEAEAVIVDENQREIRRLPLSLMAHQSSESSDYGYKLKSYELMLPEDLYDLKRFSVIIELKASKITLTSNRIYTHSKEGRDDEGVSAGTGFTVSYDE